MADFDTRFREAWDLRPPRKVVVEAVKGTRGYPRGTITQKDKDRLARVVSKTAEVMVRVTKPSTKDKEGNPRTTTPKGEGVRLGNFLNYITRGGELELETSDGLTTYAKEDRTAIRAEWVDAHHDNIDTGRATPKTRLYKTVILSMPPGTDTQALRDAARAFAAEEFAGHTWVMTLHTDRAHPHVHIGVQTVRQDGRQLRPNRDDLQGWRETFARELRMRGVEAEATPRHARGAPRQERPELHQLRQRGAVPRIDGKIATQVAREGALDRPADVAARERRQWIIDIYLDASSALRATGQPEDARLAAKVGEFVAQMPGYANPRLAAQFTLPPAPVAEVGGVAQLYKLGFVKPEQARERWQELAREFGTIKAGQIATADPAQLGDVRGRRLFSIDTAERRAALGAVAGLAAEYQRTEARTAHEALQAARVAVQPPAAEPSGQDRRPSAVAALRPRGTPAPNSSPGVLDQPIAPPAPEIETPLIKPKTYRP
jgi:type IV secretion system T-DNA border endonuclease VirD2